MLGNPNAHIIVVYTVRHDQNMTNMHISELSMKTRAPTMMVMMQICLPEWHFCAGAKRRAITNCKSVNSEKSIKLNSVNIRLTQAQIGQNHKCMKKCVKTNTFWANFDFFCLLCAVKCEGRHGDLFPQPLSPTENIQHLRSKEFLCKALRTFMA
jgi:hypothetical protein